MQIACELVAPADDRAISERAAALGVSTSPLSQYALAADPTRGLHLGFAAVPEEQAERAVARLTEAILS
jgi:GntR family transcriptional regulator/MocR family aminotransferase